jgi:hypothetical protein
VSDIQISGLPTSNTFADTDVIAIEVDGVTYKVTGAVLAAALRTIGSFVSSADLPLAAEHGGTGVTSLQAARNAMGLGNTTGALPIANGGTGATTAEAAMTALGALSASTIYNGLDKTASGFALDARQGKALNDALAAKLSESAMTVSGTTVTGITLNGTECDIADADAREDITELDGEIEQLAAQIQQGLTQEIKTALLNAFQHVAWADDDGEDYYNDLADALVTVEVTSIDAVFTQGTAVITPNTPLDNLREYLTVTATYSDTTTRVVSNYTLSGTLAVGQSTITATYFDKSDTFTVTVTQGTQMIRSWDFTTSLVDSVTGATVTTTATRGSSGLTFTAINQYVDYGAVYSRGYTYEIDVDYIGTPDSGSSAYRRLFAFGEHGTDTSSGTSALIVAMSSYRPGWYWYLGSAWDSRAIGSAVSSVDSYNYFDGKTVKIYIDPNGIGKVYAKTIGADDSTYVYIGDSAGALTDYSTASAHVYTGSSSSDRMCDARIRGFRVYGGEK